MLVVNIRVNNLFHTVMMTSAGDVERRLCVQPDSFELRANESAKSDVWKQFSLIFEKNASDASLSEVKFYCACNTCRRVYAYKAQDGSSFGTKNLLDHVRQCKSDKAPKVQLTLAQCVRQAPKIAKDDRELLKRQQVKFCVDGYHSFRSVEHDGLRDLLQTWELSMVRWTLRNVWLAERRCHGKLL